jgi:hypothetical protein
MADILTNNPIFSKQNRPPVHFIGPNGKDVITLDCSVQEKHTRESPPTEFEVENGQTVNDHIIIKPFSLLIEGIISDTPLSLFTQIVTAGISYIAPSAAVLGKNAPALALASALSPSDFLSKPSVKAYSDLIDLQSLRQPVTVWTSLYLYKNMWIKSISVPRNSKTGRVLNFTVELVQLRLVAPQTINIAKMANPDVGAGKTDKGKQNASSPEGDAAKAGFASGQNTVNGVFGTQ